MFLYCDHCGARFHTWQSGRRFCSKKCCYAARPPRPSRTDGLMSDDEIVEEYYKITGERITRQTVGNVLRRALKKMRKELEDMGVSEESVFG
jgi:hypothetical protein